VRHVAVHRDAGVVAAGTLLEPDALTLGFARRFTGYKRPKFIEFRDELPKTPVGKILRRALRDELRESSKPAAPH